jgi:hypothetical protein
MQGITLFTQIYIVNNEGIPYREIMKKLNYAVQRIDPNCYFQEEVHMPAKITKGAYLM